MTNEAQTNIIVAQARKMLPMMKSTLGESIERYADFFKKSLLNMAKWKDQQFKEYLEKKKAACPSFGGLLGERASGYEDGYRNCIEQIINELFKED